MANIKISAAADAGTLLSSDMLPLARSGDTNAYHATMAEISTFASSTVSSGAYGNVGRNLVHNGMFNVQQRGQGAWTTNNTYTADRWVQQIAGGDAIGTSIYVAGDPGRAATDEAMRFQLGCVVTGTSTASSQTLVSQFIEDAKRLGGKTVTVSFWLQTTAALRFGVNINQNFGAGGSPSSLVVVTGQSVASPANTWTRYSLTFAVPSTIGKTFGTNGNDCTQLNFWMSCPAANSNYAASGNVGQQSGSFFLWGVQLEVGSVMTQLEKPDQQQDLAKCQRFYQTGNFNVSGYNVAGGTCASTTALLAPMRATPTVVPTTGGATNASSLTVQAVSPFALNVQFVATATGQAVYYGPYTASADL